MQAVTQRASCFILIEGPSAVFQVPFLWGLCNLGCECPFLRFFTQPTPNLATSLQADYFFCSNATNFSHQLR